MGRLNTIEEQRSTLLWATAYQRSKIGKNVCSSIAELRSIFSDDLRRYFALAALSRSTTAPAQMVSDALALVFGVRVIIEQSIASELFHSTEEYGFNFLNLQQQPLHGYSSKQGVSIRMPLSSCIPTKVCGAACYAHDVLDAAPASVFRGAINGAIAKQFEESGISNRQELLLQLHRPILKMMSAAFKDARAAATTFKRRPRIRFAHVGEFATYPNYANALAKFVSEHSNGGIDCVVYTRHPDAKLLDPDLFVVLFSLDESSEDRRRFIPAKARAVRSAFGGSVTDTVDVNFLEHHRWVHIKPVGIGYVCPSTAPDTKVRTCDACHCDFCFKPKLSPFGLP